MYYCDICGRRIDGSFEKASSNTARVKIEKPRHDEKGVQQPERHSLDLCREHYNRIDGFLSELIETATKPPNGPGGDQGQRELTEKQACVLSAYTKNLLIDWSTFHKWVEKRLDRPVQTAEFANPHFAKKLKDDVKPEIHELIPGDIDESEISGGRA